jgi:nitroreductase
MAQNLGFGTCWIGSFDRKLVKDIIGADGRPTMILLVGKPDDAWQAKHYRDPKAFGYSGDPWRQGKEKIVLPENMRK